MRLYDKEVNRCNYKTFNTDDLEKFKSMLKSNIRNFNELVEPTIETMINEDKAEELLAYIEREIKARDRNTAIKKFSKELRHNPYCRQSYRSMWFSCRKINLNKPKMLIQYGGDTWQFDEVEYEQE